MSNAIAEIAAERQRQIDCEGWTVEHDDAHAGGELSLAAACYAMTPSGEDAPVPPLWPWNEDWWKPKDERRNLIRAAALIVAEIERLDRAVPSQGRESEVDARTCPHGALHGIGCGVCVNELVRDGRRYRRLRALTEYGHFIIQHHPGDGDNLVTLDGYQHEVDAAIDDPVIAAKADAYMRVLAKKAVHVERNAEAK